MVTRAPSPTTNYNSYRVVLQEACGQEPEQWTFKSDPRYRLVLEHVTRREGLDFLYQIQAEHPTEWPAVLELLPDIVRDTERYGKPAVEPFDVLGFPCSPSNFRYLSQALRLWTHAVRCGMQRMHVVEIGGGYGALALYVHRLANLFPVSLDRYTIIDLPEATHIQARTAKELHVPLHVANGLNAQSIEAAIVASDASRFLFSAYAFSEFDADTRAWYEELVVRHCEHGLLVWNFHDGPYGIWDRPIGGPVYQFVDKPLRVDRHRPPLAEHVKLVTF